MKNTLSMGNVKRILLLAFIIIPINLYAKDNFTASCKEDGFSILKKSPRFRLFYESTLRSFGSMKSSDFDKSLCFGKANIFDKNIFTFSFLQENKSVVGQKFQNFVAFDALSEQILVIMLDSDNQTYILGSGYSLLFDALKQSFEQVKNFNEIDFESKLTFNDIGARKKIRESAINHESGIGEISAEKDKVSSSDMNDNCSYKKLSGQEYRIKNNFKKYVTNSFEIYADKEIFQQGNKGDYESLREYNFKVLETGVRTVSSKQILSPVLSKYRYNYIYNKSNSFVADNSYRTKVLTKDCKVFYYRPSYDFNIFMDEIELSSGKNVSFENFKTFLGKALFIPQIESRSSYDKFEKSIIIKTDMYDDYMLIAQYSLLQKKITFMMLYTDQVFYKNWAFITTSKDANGNVHKVTRINGDADCSGDHGCKLTETLAIDVSEQFLKNNRNGFELKLSGRTSRVINISGSMIQSFLKELAKVKK